jgi:hypothetical protein
MEEMNHFSYVNVVIAMDAPRCIVSVVNWAGFCSVLSHFE